MSIPVNSDAQGTSTRPYLIRALHDWCTDNGFTPYLAVHVDDSVRVPLEYVKNQEIVLNVGFEATSALKLGNEWIEFKARFGGVAREIQVPVDHVVAIYARENGQGMAFPMPTGAETSVDTSASADADADANADASDAPAPEPAARGLRLAGTEPAHSDALAQAKTKAKEPAADLPPDTPPAGPGGAPNRPTLKRVK